MTKIIRKSMAAALFGASLMAFSGAASWADSHCECDQKCAESCAKAEGKKGNEGHAECTCKSKCSQGKCERCKGHHKGNQKNGA